ncbi:hypothetical protein SFRURICE_011862 [Spodoptera frugiperda]|nr:hypothetical protein SFRURICE_011862 [Spodoptera frugiperda]
MTEVIHRLSTSKSSDDVTNTLHRTYEVYMQNNTDRKSQRTTVGQKAHQADHLAWSEDPPFLRELYSLFPKVVTPTSAPSSLSPSPSPITSPLSGNQVAANQHPRPHQGPPHATSKICSLKSHIDYRRANQRMTSYIYEVCMRNNTDRKSQRTTVGQKARQADHLAWSEDPPFLRELYSLFPKPQWLTVPTLRFGLINTVVLKA